MRLIIRWDEGGASKSFDVPLAEKLILFGRGQKRDCFYPLPACAGSYLSKNHCTVFEESGEWWICSGAPGGAPAKNGIWLNGKRVESPRKIEVGDIFVLLFPPPCEIQMHVVDSPELEDTLTPAIERLDLLNVDEILKIKEAVSLLHAELAENRNLDLTLQGKLAHLRAETLAASELFGQFNSELSQSIKNLQADFKAQQKQQIKASRHLARVISLLSLAIAGFGLIAFAADKDRRQDYSAIAVEILLITLGSGGTLATLHKEEND